MTALAAVCGLHIFAAVLLVLTERKPRPRHRCPKRADWLLALAAAWDLLRPPVLIGA